MQAAKQESWKIRVYAKSKNFNFRLKATKIPVTRNWKFHRFSFFLKLPGFLLLLKSDSAASFARPRRQSLKSRFLRAVEKFRPRLAKKHAVTAKETAPIMNSFFQEPVCTSSLVFGILVFLFRSIYETDQSVILVVGSVMLLYRLTLPKRNITENCKTVLAFSVLVAAVFSSVMFGLKKFLNYDRVCIAEFAWKTWKCISWILDRLLSEV
ncbi:Polyketide synthase [Melia azedarach]|uniref:Polyketide synthase n=1 Tax=Melia azedarach TaxID=155640 RepID=A0ACC1WYX3_MELAZ|nr:Polyketide synthase [Melia azedarach]